MSLEQTLERIAVALETMVAGQADIVARIHHSTKSQSYAVDATAAEITVPGPGNIIEMPQPAAEGDGALDRNYIKSQLDEKGIEYNNRAATKTLQGILAKAAKAAVEEAKAEAGEQPTATTSASESATAPAPEAAPAEVDYETAKNALIAYVGAKGKDKGMAILTGLGVSKISELDAAGRAKMMEMVNA